MGSPTPENSLAKFRVSLLQPPFWPHFEARPHTIGLAVTKFCVLQVEDDPNDISLLSFAFQKFLPHHILRSVTSGREARAYLAGEGQFADRDRFPFPHVVLLDLKLPDEDGFEVLRWIRSQPPTQSLVVILFSASVFPGDVEKGLSLGANSYVAKFGDLDELAAFFHAIEAYWFNFHLFHSPACLRLEGTSLAA